MKKIFKESISLLHKLWYAYIFVLFFKPMDNVNIFVSKDKFPHSFSCYKCLTCYFVAKCYFKIHRGAVPPCRAHFVQRREMFYTGYFHYHLHFYLWT